MNLGDNEYSQKLAEKLLKELIAIKITSSHPLTKVRLTTAELEALWETDLIWVDDDGSETLQGLEIVIDDSLDDAARFWIEDGKP